MDEEAPPEVVTVEAISVDPNNCALDCELNIAMSFTALQFLPQARWEIRFIADQAHKRKIVELGSTPTQDYPVGEHSMTFSVPEVSVAHLSRHVLANVGLLLVVLDFLCLCPFPFLLVAASSPRVPRHPRLDLSFVRVLQSSPNLQPRL